MDAEHVFNHVVKDLDHDINSCNIEEELLIAARLGQELLAENDAIQEKNRILSEINREYAREIEMLRLQNKKLREESDSKSAEQLELDKKSCDVECAKRALERDVVELQNLLATTRTSNKETEKLYLEETRRCEVVTGRVCELERELETCLITETLRPTSPTCDYNIRLNHKELLLNRSEEKRRRLESELKLLLEDNCDLYSKVETLEGFKQNHTCTSYDTLLQEDTRTPEEEAECGSNGGSFTSESWLSEKLATLEERYNRACDGCICGACEPLLTHDKGDTLDNVSYQELFNQLFEGLRSIQLSRTPRSTLKKKKQAKTPVKNLFFSEGSGTIN